MSFPSRIQYAFDALYVCVFGRWLPFPGVRGGGWTEASYCDDTLRVMANSQGDTLVFVKVEQGEQEEQEQE